LDFGDMDSQKWLDYSKFRRFPVTAGYWLEGTKLNREEKALARKFDLCTCTTKAELATLDGLNSANQTGWFPNGVDSEYFKPNSREYDPNLICFVGRMDYYPNQQAMMFFCNEVLPRIQSSHPAARLAIVGAEPSSEIRSLGSRPGITVTGTVDDVRPHVLRSALTVAPLAIARGTQNKILESMAMGVPVVCSAKAAGGVDARVNEDLLVADSVDNISDCVIRILSRPEERARLARSARSRVESHHNWSASMARLDALLQSLGA
jgi:sugar transferase (PEP-CTERM/EpsH1 system associated)